MIRVFASVAIIIAFLTPASPLLASEIEFVGNTFFLTTSHRKPITETVIIKNGTGQIQNVSLDWEGYKPTAKHSIDFVEINPTDLTLQPFASAQVEIDFSPPDDILPGDYYGTLKAGSDSEQTTKTEFTLRILGISEENVDVKSVFDNGSTLKVMVANSGSRTTKLKLTTVIEGLFGFLTTTNNANLELKASESKQILLTHAVLWPGAYQADVKIDYGNGKSERKIKNFWVSPKLIGLTLVLLLIGSAAVITEFRRKRA